MSDATIREEDPIRDDIAALLAVHLKTMHAQSPACSVHALDLEGLRQPEVTFWSMRLLDGTLVGCGALKRLGAHHGEIKSMHIAEGHRGQGHAQALLAHILTDAAARDICRISLETGSQPEFEAARKLYAAAGFKLSGPFADYTEDPNSVFMTRVAARGR